MISEKEALEMIQWGKTQGYSPYKKTTRRK